MILAWNGQQRALTDCSQLSEKASLTYECTDLGVHLKYVQKHLKNEGGKSVHKGIRSQVTVKLYILWIDKAEKIADNMTEKIL